MAVGEVKGTDEMDKIASFVFSNTNYLQLLVVYGIYLIVQTLERILEGFSLIRLHDKDVIVFLVQSLLLVFMAILFSWICCYGQNLG